MKNLRDFQKNSETGAVEELTRMLRETSTSTYGRIDDIFSGLENSFKKEWQEKVFKEREDHRLSQEDPVEWLNQLIDQFCKQTSFPKEWGKCEKVALFGKLFLSQRNKSDKKEQELVSRNCTNINKTNGTVKRVPKNNL